MKYLRGSQNIGLTLECNDPTTVQWWVDASYGVHADMRGQTGGLMSLGKGAIYATSTKQKLNTRSSTESELVGMHDVLPQVLWTRLFLQAQGVSVTSNVMHQDNKSAILLGTNGKGSSSRRTRHINTRYFFVKDKIEKGEVQLAYCSSKDMVADFFTKPLQGMQFNQFRNKIMNHVEDDIAPHSKAHEEHRSVLEKLVIHPTSESEHVKHG